MTVNQPDYDQLVKEERNEESAPPPPERTPAWFLKRLALRVAVWFTTFSIVYVFSIGPMYWLWYDAVYAEGTPAFSRLYFPLMKLCQASDAMADWVEWYISLWIF